jgi:tetratricopeptide (TPR) repeat protein
MPGVKKALTCLRRWSCLLVLAFCGAYLAFRLTQHSSWYKGRLYHRLVCCAASPQIRAASALACLGAQDQLLAGLKSDVPSVRELARRGLEYVWFSSAGSGAYHLVEAAYQATEAADYPKALKLLNQLTEQHPRFAEGFNRRAAIYWKLGDYEKSIADSQTALALNPNHYGAWQGLGLCRLQLGEVAAACRCLRAALEIAPYDEGTRSCLTKCEDLLRALPKAVSRAKTSDLI